MPYEFPKASKKLKKVVKKAATSVQGNNRFAGKSGSAKSTGAKMHSKASSLTKGKASSGMGVKHKT